MNIFKAMSKLPALISGMQQLQQRQLAITAGATQNLIARYPDWRITENSKRYSTCDDVYSIISLLANTSAQIPLQVFLVKDEAAAKKLKALPPTGPQFFKSAMHIKALIDLPDADPLVTLLATPNTYQSEFEFRVLWFTWLYMHGESFIYKQSVDLGVNAGKPVALHVLDPQYMVPLVSGTFPQAILGWRYIVAGRIILECGLDEIIHVKYPNPCYTYNGNELRGLSPLATLTRRFERMDSNMNNSVAQMQNGGNKDIIFEQSDSDQATDADGKEISIIGNIKNDFGAFISNQNNTGAPYFASGKIGGYKLGSTLVDMMSVELEAIDFKKLCNVYHISDRLFNNDATGSEISDDNARKGMITNACLPNVYLLRDAYNRSIVPAYTDKKRMVSADTSEIPELQDSFKSLTDGLVGAWWITANERRQLMRQDAYADPLADEILIPAGFTPISEYGALAPVEDIVPPPPKPATP